MHVYLEPGEWGDDERPVESIGFDYDHVERNLSGIEPAEEKVTWSDMSASFSLVLQWVVGSNQSKHARKPNLTMSGARANSLLFLLDPVHALYSSLSEIADDAGVTRAALSKAVCLLREELDGILPLKQTTERMRHAQKAALRDGCHSSQVRLAKRDKLRLEAV